MSKYIFHEGQLAKNFKPVFERFLFNEERHLHSQSLDGWKTFSLIDNRSKLVFAQVNFHIENSTASSPYKAPFGSFEFNESLSIEVLFNFLVEVENKLKEQGVIKVAIKDVPHLYRPQESAILSVLLMDLNFEVVKSEINSSIVVDEVLWRDKISQAELKRLRRCEREQLIFQSLGLSELEEVYNFTRECRHERDAELSVTYASLKYTVEKCPDDFLLFGVFQKKELIASAISVRVTNSIIYNFYHAHRKSSDQLSPIVFLLDNQYSYCRQNGFRLLDLGTSSLENKTNFSLLNFKTQVGGIFSMKLTFEKELQ
ncbi:MAG: hypothetical protein HY015_01290 [Bacteroidetes bacterium]|nr:hypothetical protein [Bacteroidota bacterium]MBI3481611.1 hypothetical protein [Bacteroidota bacterium]